MLNKQHKTVISPSSLWVPQKMSPETLTFVDTRAYRRIRPVPTAVDGWSAKEAGEWNTSSVDGDSGGDAGDWSRSVSAGAYLVANHMLTASIQVSTNVLVSIVQFTLRSMGERSSYGHVRDIEEMDELIVLAVAFGSAAGV